MYRGVNPAWGLGILDRGFWRVAGGRGLAGREIILLSYHVQEVCSKVVTFEEK